MGSNFSTLDLMAAMPLVSLLLGVTGMLLVDLFTVEKRHAFFTFVGVLCCLAAIMFSTVFWIMGDVTDYAFKGAFAIDRFTAFFSYLILGGTICTLLLNSNQLDHQGVRSKVDIDVLVLLSAAGGLVMVAAADLITLFLGFELLSVSVYVLAGTARKERGSAEGALKYFLLGAFSSAFLLYGIALTYGGAGSVNFPEIASAIQLGAGSNLILLTGLALMVFGFAFKISLVPFHFWAPDAYQGTPTSLATFMAVVVKAAAFGAFLRLLTTAFMPLSEIWIGALSVLCGLSMTVGNIVALRQRSMKRLLAYSSIAHAGYALLGLVVGTADGFSAAILYLVIYSVMTVASFGMVLIVTAGTEKQYLRDDIESFRGLGWSHPVLGFFMTVALLSLAGIPPLAGFFGKLYLFKAAVSAGFIGLTILAALNSVVSLYYYLSILVVMYFSESGVKESRKIVVPFSSSLAVSFAVVGLLILGISSGRIMTYSSEAIRSLSERQIRYLNLSENSAPSVSARAQLAAPNNQLSR